MDGFYCRRFELEDIKAVMERIREILGLPDHAAALRLLGQAGLEPSIHCTHGRLPNRFLDSLFDLCAEHGLNRMYILRGIGPARMPDE